MIGNTVRDATVEEASKAVDALIKAVIAIERVGVSGHYGVLGPLYAMRKQHPDTPNHWSLSLSNALVELYAWSSVGEYGTVDDRLGTYL